MTLRAKALLLVVLNIGLVALVVGGVLVTQLRRPFDSWLLSAGRERLDALARLLVLELQTTGASDRDALLHRHAAEQGAALLLVRNDGTRIAGPQVVVPEAVVARLRGPAEGRPEGPPRPPFERPERGPAGGSGAPGREGRPPDGAGVRRDGTGAPPDHAGGPPDGAGAPPHGPGTPLPGTPPFLVRTGGELRYWVGVRMPVPVPGQPEPIKGTLLVASPRFWSHPFLLDVRPWLIVAALVAATSLLCWLPFLGRLTSAVGEMTRATASIADGRFDVALPTARGDELGLLAASISTMAGRLETLMRGQKRFLADVAHELRSPLGRMQMALGVLEARVSPDERPRLEDLREEVELMSRLTDELLAFAKAELRPEATRLTRTSVAEAAARAVRLEARDGADVRVEVGNDLHVQAEPEYLFRSLANVLRNAVRYAGGAGPITVRAQPQGDRVVITVADFGPGLPAASLARVFEPFYRPEDSRDRRSGGTGLGLAIVRRCVEACGGSVECSNGEPSGLVVTISLMAA